MITFNRSTLLTANQLMGDEMYDGGGNFQQGSNESDFSFYNGSLFGSLDNLLSSTSNDTSSLYSSPATVFGVLVTFSACTIFGNSLVMLAVTREYYLKSPPNYFVASLAAADFFVGVLLLPFEAITQLLDRRWIFGELWCDIWHSFDVLLTTASILNLCVISLDRYWAICTPFVYSRRMTSKRAFRFIALVWICATVISFPAIFWWRGVRTGSWEPGTCPFTDDVSYLVSSSCISFYIPLSVMLFAYYKIYKAAVKQSKSIQQGAKLFAHDETGKEMTLRMHRGGSGSNSNNNGSSNSSSATSSQDRTSLSSRKSFSFVRSDPTGLSLLGKRGLSVKTKSNRASHFRRNKLGKRTFSESNAQPGNTTNCSNANTICTFPSSMSDDERPEAEGVSAAVRLISHPLVMIAASTTNNTSPGAVSNASSSFQIPHQHRSNLPTVTFRSSRRSFTVARKLAKFAKEKKAAKTLAIVLGVFIICWLPFFVINVVFALCKSCAEGHVIIFEVATWLGWVNSAMNPVIYACWSHDFRRAFTRLLCCGRCGRARQRRNLQRRLSCV